MRHLLTIIRRLFRRPTPPRYFAHVDLANTGRLDVDALVVWRREQDESVRIVWPENRGR